MPASSFFPIRWTRVPVTLTPNPRSSSRLCRRASQPLRQGFRERLRQSSETLLSSAWYNLKHLFTHSHQSPIHQSELLAETQSSSQGSVYPNTSNFSQYSFDTSSSCSSFRAYLVPGAFCNSCHGHNINPFIPATTMDVVQNLRTVKPKKSFERDWKEIRQRFERKIASAAAQAISGRPGGGDIRKPRWAAPPKLKEPRNYQVQTEDKLTKRGANPRTGVPSPSNNTDGSSDDSRPRLNQKWKMAGDQWVSVDVSQTPSPQSSPLTFELQKTISSAGSGSTDISSNEDWEDRFVVHMPSANDPSPPTLSSEQIRLYQERLGKKHTATVKRHEMDASKPSCGSPTDRNASSPKSSSRIPVLYQSSYSHTSSLASSQSISPPVDGPKQKYFSPDEVGQARVSPVNDSPKARQDELLKRLREECFLGCLGVDEAAAKNPDEILLFPNLDDGNEQSEPSSIKTEDGGNKAKQHNIPRTSKLPQPTGQPLAAQKPRPKPRLSKPNSRLAIPASLTAAPATNLPKLTTSQSSGFPTDKNGKRNLSNFTPPVPISAKETVDTAVLQGSRSRLVFKPLPKVQNSSNECDQLSPEHDLFFQGSSASNSPSTPNNFSDEDASDESARRSSSDLDGKYQEQILHQKTKFHMCDDTFGVNTKDILNYVPENGTQLCDLVSSTELYGRNTYHVRNQKSAKAPSVAELDGHQVPQQLPSPPPSASGSPPMRAKIDTSPKEKKTTHAIRIQLRMKAEKAKEESQKRRVQPKTETPAKEKRTTHDIRMEIRTKAERARQAAAAAKTASEQLSAARKQAERMAQTRAALDKGKTRSEAKQISTEPTEEQRLNTQKINEARRIYKAAKAKEEAEKMMERACKREQKEKGRVSSEPFLNLTASKTAPSNDAKPTRKSSRKSGNRRLSNRQFKKEKLPDAAVHDNKRPEAAPPVSVSKHCLMPDISFSSGTFYLSLASFQDFLQYHQVYSHVVCCFEELFQMATHCFKVCQRLAGIWLEYQESGVLSTSCVEEFGQLAGDVAQALVNSAVLYIALMVVVKAAGYVLIVANWALWFTKPIGWVFGHILGVVEK